MSSTRSLLFSIAAEADEAEFDFTPTLDDLDEPEPAPVEPLPPPVYEPPHQPPAKTVAEVLQERPDVLDTFYRTFYEGGADKNPAEWRAKIGGETPEDYAKYWLDKHGKWEGYGLTGGDTVSVERLILERPDVMASYYRNFYEEGHDKHPEAWVAKVGGASLEDYAKYWFDRHGKWEGYTQSPTGETLSAERILTERPDVLRGFYVEFYENGAFRKPADWMQQIGGKTPEDYAKYWYDHHGKWEGYSQPAPPPPPPEPIPEEPPFGPEPEPSLPEEPVATPEEALDEEQVVELIGVSAADDAFV